jgi:hypothetical protein
MTSRRRALADLPDWPLWLTRAEAARYVGVSTGVFDLEVEWGWWPSGRARGLKGGKLTWCKLDLDARSRAPDDYEARRDAWRDRNDHPTTEHASDEEERARMRQAIKARAAERALDRSRTPAERKEHREQAREAHAERAAARARQSRRP